MSHRPVVILACRVFQGLLQRCLPEHLAGCTPTYLEYGLHRTPARLREALQAQIDALGEPSLVVLGYGLCGNGLAGLQAGSHRLLVPKADDCIAILLGSRRRYMERFDSQPGTYYLTRGWLETGHDPLGEYEAYSQHYGVETAQWLMDQQFRHYQRLALVSHSPSDLEASRPRARRVAAYCQRWGMEYEEVTGSQALVKKMFLVAAGEAPVDEDFVMVEPGGTVSPELFLPTD
jgi:hypothetical protein